MSAALQGEPVFAGVWVCGLAFQGAHVLLLISLAQAIERGGRALIATREPQRAA